MYVALSIYSHAWQMAKVSRGRNKIAYYLYIPDRFPFKNDTRLTNNK